MPVACAAALVLVSTALGVTAGHSIARNRIASGQKNSKLAAVGAGIGRTATAVALAPPAAAVGMAATATPGLQSASSCLVAGEEQGRGALVPQLTVAGFRLRRRLCLRSRIRSRVGCGCGVGLVGRQMESESAGASAEWEVSRF